MLTYINANPRWLWYRLGDTITSLSEKVANHIIESNCVITILMAEAEFFLSSCIRRRCRTIGRVHGNGIIHLQVYGSCCCWIMKTCWLLQLLEQRQKHLLSFPSLFVFGTFKYLIKVSLPWFYLHRKRKKKQRLPTN